MIHQNETMQENVDDYQTQFLESSTRFAYDETSETLVNEHSDVTVVRLVSQLSIVTQLNHQIMPCKYYITNTTKCLLNTGQECLLI